MVPAMWLSFPATRRPSDAESTLSGLLWVPRAEKGRSAATIPVRRRRGLGIPTVDLNLQSALLCRGVMHPIFWNRADTPSLPLP